MMVKFVVHWFVSCVKRVHAEPIEEVDGELGGK